MRSPAGLVLHAPLPFGRSIPRLWPPARRARPCRGPAPASPGSPTASPAGVQVAADRRRSRAPRAQASSGAALRRRRSAAASAPAGAKRGDEARGRRQLHGPASALPFESVVAVADGRSRPAKKRDGLAGERLTGGGQGRRQRGLAAGGDGLLGAGEGELVGAGAATAAGTHASARHAAAASGSPARTPRSHPSEPHLPHSFAHRPRTPPEMSSRMLGRTGAQALRQGSITAGWRLSPACGHG